MKILPINNQDNISHKAYFKQNEVFMSLYKKAKKTEPLAKAAKFFKEVVPNHELEIVRGLKNEKFPNILIYEIVNNVTEKIKTVLSSDDENSLLAIVSHLNLYRDSDFFKYDDEETDIDCLSLLT